MNSDAAFDAWYAAQRHQLSNEQVCRLIWNRAWQTAREAVSAAAGSAEPAGKVCMESNFPDTDGWARRRFMEVPSAPSADAEPAFGQSYRCTRCSELMPKPPEPHLYCEKCCRADSDRLDELETNCWGLKAFAIPNTDGDEFGWKVVQQRTHGGRDVVIATEHSDDLRAAIDAASGIERGDSSHG